MITGEGAKTVYVKFKDTVGNWSTAVGDAIVFDTTAPTTTASPTGGTYTTSLSVTLMCNDGTGGGCDKIYYTTDGTIPTTSSSVYSAPIPMSEPTTLKFLAIDLAGYSEAVKTQTYTIDTMRPTGSVSINGGANYTNASTVTLTLSCTDNSGCDYMEISNYNTVWQGPYATTKVWTLLPSGDGAKTVYVNFRDTAGNWMSTSVSATIVLDTTVPVTTVSPTEGTYNATKLVTLTCGDGTGAGCDKIYYTTDGTTPTTASSVYAGAITVAATTTLKYFATDAAGNSEAVKSKAYIIDTTLPVTTVSPAGGAYNTSQTISLTCSDGAGTGCDKIYYTTNGTTPTTSSSVYSTPISVSTTTTLKFFATDLAGNTEVVKNQTYTIDITPPTGTVTINAGANYTNTAAATLTLSCNDSVGCDQMQFSNDNASWSSPETHMTTKVWTLVLGDGTKTVYAKFKDMAGNWSTAVSDTIVFDATAPVTTASPAGGVYNAAKSVTMTCGDGTGAGCDKIYYTTDGTTPTTASSVYSGAITVAATATLKYFATDLVGNSETVKSQTYTIDTTPPVTAASPGSGAYNTSQTVTLACNDGVGSGCDKIYYTTNGATPTTSSSVYSTPVTVSATTTLKFFATDLVGNNETVKTQTYTIDTTPPTGTITVNSGAAYVTAANVTLALSCTDSVGCSQMQFSNDNSNWSSPESYATTKAWTLATGDGNKTVYVKFKDTAGNWSTVYSDTILLDATAPVTTASPAGGFYNTSKTVTLTSNDGAGLGVDKIYYTIDGTTPTTSSSVYADPINITATTTLKFFATDLAGHTETVKTKTYTIDVIAPTVTITSPALGTTNDNSPLLTYTTNDGTWVSNVVVKVDGVIVSKVSGYSLAPLADGIHTVRVEATDLAGNTGFAEVVFTVALAFTGKEDFETGDLTLLPWVTTGNGQWFVQDSDAHGDSYAAQAPSIGLGQSAAMEVSMDCTTGNIDFWYSVNSLFDNLTFYIDGVQQLQKSGFISWTQASYEVTAGRHTFKWVYSNGMIVPVGIYTAMVDDIVFPIGAGDTTPPSGTITINSGAAYTKTTDVTLALSCTDNSGACSQMQFSTDNVSWSTPEAYSATKAWTLTAGDSTKNVYVKFKDAAGNWSTAYSDAIGLDATAPATTASPAGGTYTAIQTVTLSCSDGPGAGCDKVYYTTDGSTPTTSSSVYSWAITVASTQTLKYFATDLAGNSETVKSQSYTFDTTPPTGTITINTGAAYTKTTAVTLTLSCTDNAGACNQMQFSNDNASWSTPEAYATTKVWTFATVDGIKTIYVKFRDESGNWSTVSIDTIVLDATNPVTTTAPAGGAYNTSQAVTLTCSDGTGTGCDKIYYTTDGATPTTSSSVYSGALTVAATTTVKYFATDLAGNSEAVKSQAYTITASDTTPPSGTITINSGAAYTKTTTTTLSLSCTDNAGACNQMQFSNDNASWSAPEAYATTKAWTSATGDGTKTVYAKFKDAAGNWSSVVSDTIVLDSTTPVVAITSPTTGTTTDNTPLLTYTASDGTVVVKVDGSIVNKVSGTSLDTLANGSHNVRVEATDAAGNIAFAEVTFTVSASVTGTEDFETGNLSNFPWITSGNGLWAVKSTKAHGGAYSAQAPSITVGQSAAMEVTMDCTAGNISFWYAVNSLFDNLKFYIDGVLKLQKSGSVSWTLASYGVTTGRHTFKWVYSYSMTGSAASTAWVDDITFPIP
ncbi:chitobiase/beta-hexosaminidase C-terminal domain-containing protein [Geotalea uraniireducens]|nr:chitobiase/beta-hexosaminidase C-terminal domain-containing protein [Geotalea uraniireducens]